MKLRELVLQEEAIETKLAADVWTENKTDASTYMSNEIFAVKKIDGKDLYDVTSIDGAKKRSTYAKLSKSVLDSTFVLLRPNSIPDAEGYIQYRDASEVKAIKYSGDTLKIGLDSKDVASTKIVAGDYLVQKSDEKEFKYSVEKARDFEGAYTKK